MSRVKHALLLLGSPRAIKKSTSHSLGVYLLRALEEAGAETSFIHIQRALRSEERLATLIESFRQSDLVILSCPLYVDSLPAPVVRCLEILADERPVHDKGLVAIMNCGFPESQHIKVALRICRRFAEETGMIWKGGLGLGGGEAIGGRSLEEAGGLARNIKRSLQLSAESLAEGHPVPVQAKQLISRNLVPVWLYKWMGHRGWKRQAKRYGTRKELMARPFLSDH